MNKIMIKSACINLLTFILLSTSLNALAVHGVLAIHNEWGDEVSYKLSNAIATTGTLDPDDSDTVYINKTTDLDKMNFTYLVDGESYSRTINHTCGYTRTSSGSLKLWLEKTQKAAIYITYPGRGKHPVFTCRAS